VDEIPAQDRNAERRRRLQADAPAADAQRAPVPALALEAAKRSAHSRVHDAWWRRSRRLRDFGLLYAVAPNRWEGYVGLSGSGTSGGELHRVSSARSTSRALAARLRGRERTPWAAGGHSNTRPAGDGISRATSRSADRAPWCVDPVHGPDATVRITIWLPTKRASLAL
jgi:hypothetical protein